MSSSSLTYDLKTLTFYDFNHCSGTRAVEIEYVDDTIGRAKGATEPLIARASRLVVLSAGAFGSPAILERSGIGSKDLLTRNNIEQFVDLPGVGEHYMGSSTLDFTIENSDQNSLDHNLIGVPFLSSDDAVTIDEVSWGTEKEVERMYAAASSIHC